MAAASTAAAATMQHDNFRCIRLPAQRKATKSRTHKHKHSWAPWKTVTESHCARKNVFSCSRTTKEHKHTSAKSEAVPEIYGQTLLIIRYQPALIHLMCDKSIICVMCANLLRDSRPKQLIGFHSNRFDLIQTPCGTPHAISFNYANQSANATGLLINFFYFSN